MLTCLVWFSEFCVMMNVRLKFSSCHGTLIGRICWDLNYYLANIFNWNVENYCMAGI